MKTKCARLTFLSLLIYLRLLTEQVIYISLPGVIGVYPSCTFTLTCMVILPSTLVICYVLGITSEKPCLTTLRDPPPPTSPGALSPTGKHISKRQKAPRWVAIVWWLLLLLGPFSNFSHTKWIFRKNTKRTRDIAHRSQVKMGSVGIW
jgi:hypothetical protein